MSLLWILVIVLLIASVGTTPYWGHQWGWGPSGGLGVILLIVVLLIVFRVIRF